MRTELNQSPVVFFPETHQYFLGDTELSGITSLIHRQLFPNMYDNVDPELLSLSAEYGKTVHKSCEDFDQQWYNDGTIEVADYISLTSSNNLHHEASEYLVACPELGFASMIDKVYRVSENRFSLGDIKTYGVMTPEKREQTRWQLSLYRYMFLRQNPGTEIDQIFILHIRNRMKKNKTFDHISEIVFLDPIPVDICRSLMEADSRGEQFLNPLDIPQDVQKQEERLRYLIMTKAAIEQELSDIKSGIYTNMLAQGITQWTTSTMRITRKLPTTRSSLDLTRLKADHPEIDYDSYQRITQVAGSLNIAI